MTILDSATIHCNKSYKFLSKQVRLITMYI